MAVANWLWRRPLRPSLEQHIGEGGDGRCPPPLTRPWAAFREARAVLRGGSAGELVAHVPPEFDVKALRRRLGLSQARFAKSLGFGGLAAVQSWEQGRRRPEGAARVPAQGDRARAGGGAARVGRVTADAPSRLRGQRHSYSQRRGEAPFTRAEASSAGPGLSRIRHASGARRPERTGLRKLEIGSTTPFSAPICRLSVGVPLQYRMPGPLKRSTAQT